MKTDILNLDKSNWQLTKLGDLASEISERLNNPKESRYDRFVGLNCLISGDNKVKKWKSTENLVSSAKIFKKGDILFARRNAYLKRSSLVNFDGCCSGDAFVLRENHEKIAPGFLAFITNSNLLWDFAISNAAGTMSKRVKWRDLSEYKLFLPPKREQEKLSELIWAIDKMIDDKLILQNKYNLFFKKYMNDYISGNFSKDKKIFRKYIFGDLGETFGGLNGKTKKDFGDGKSFITYMNVFNNSKVDLNDIGKVNIDDNEKQNKLKFGDILITGSSETPQEVGMTSVVLDNLQEYYLNSFCFGFRLHSFDTLIPEYARYLMRSDHVRNFMYKNAQGYTRFNISKETIKKNLKIILPNIEEQKRIYKKLDNIVQQIFNIKSNLKKTINMKKNLINQIF